MKNFLVLLFLVTGLTLQAQYAYITHGGANHVSVIDVATNSLLTNIPIGEETQGVAVTPDGSRAYVSALNSFNVYVIDGATLSVTGSYTLSDYIQGLAVSPNGKFLFAMHNNSNFITLIKTANGKMKTKEIGGVLSKPTCGVVSPSGRKLYVTLLSEDKVVELDIKTLAILNEMPTGDGPTQLDISPDGNSLYVTSNSDDMITKYDLLTHTVEWNASVGDTPFGVAVMPDHSAVYVANFLGNSVSVVNPADSANVVNTIPGVNFAVGVGITPDGEKALVTSTSTGSVMVIDIASSTIIATIPTGGAPQNWGKFIAPIPPMVPTNFSAASVNIIPEISISPVTSLHPNPVQDAIQIQAGIAGDYRIFSSTGILLDTWHQDNEGSFSIDIQTLAAGVYFLQLPDKSLSKVIKL